MKPALREIPRALYAASCQGRRELHPVYWKGPIAYGFRYGALHFETHLPLTCSAILGKYFTILSLHLPTCKIGT